MRKNINLISRLFNFMHAGLFHALIASLDFGSKSTFLKKYIRDITRVSNSLDPDQARRNVRPLDENNRSFNNNTPPTPCGCTGMSETSQIACAEKHQSHLQII